MSAYAEQARLSKRLATIRTDLNMPWHVADLARRAPDAPALLTIFRELEFTRLVQQFEQPNLGGMASVP